MNLSSFIQLQSIENLEYLKSKTGKPNDFIMAQMNKIQVNKFDNGNNLWDDVKKVNKSFINMYAPKEVSLGDNSNYDRFVDINVKGLNGKKIPWYDESDEAWEDGRLITAEDRIEGYKIKHGMLPATKTRVPFAYKTNKFEFNTELATLQGDYPSYEGANRNFNIKPRVKVKY